MEQAGSAADADASVTNSVSFEGFFEVAHTRLFRALYLVTGSAEEAEDVMQEAFLNVWARWGRVRIMNDPTAYLYRVAMNGFRSRWRRARKVPSREVALPHDPLTRVDDRDAVMRALATLAPRQRAALVLTTLLGYGADDAARVLGVKPSTVRALATQGRATIARVREAGTDG